LALQLSPDRDDAKTAIIASSLQHFKIDHGASAIIHPRFCIASRPTPGQNPP